MMWTDDAIEALKKLALEGRSASVIAAELGAPSRNAVIGKANRIGVRLNGDGRAEASGARPLGVRRASRAGDGEAPTRTRVPSRKTWPFIASAIGDMRRITFDDIRGQVCRWPLGDPLSADFAYCGLNAAEGASYCAGHRHLAYQPPKPGLRSRGWGGSSPSHWSRARFD
jgi:GcrA cell cycle regulator